MTAPPRVSLDVDCPAEHAFKKEGQNHDGY